MHVLASLPVLVALIFLVFCQFGSVWPTLMIFLLCALTFLLQHLASQKKEKRKKKREQGKRRIEVWEKQKG